MMVESRIERILTVVLLSIPGHSDEDRARRFRVATQAVRLENALVRYQMERVVPGPIGSRHPSSTPFGLFKAKDTYLVIAAGNDKMFPKLCDALGVPEAKNDPRFTTSLLRCTHHAEMKVFLEQVLAARTADDWLQHLVAAGLPCGPVNTVADLMQDAQVNARGMLIEFALPDGATMVTACCPVQFAGDGPRLANPAPALDQHRGALLRELGLRT